MKDEIIVRCGGAGLRLAASPLYLGDEPLTRRITFENGASVASKGTGEHEQSFPVIHYFSIPSHLLEMLWLDEIPAMTGVAEPHSKAAQDSGEWRCLDALAILLETIDSAFVKPIDAIFQSSAYTAEGSADSNHDICQQASEAAHGASKQGGWRRAAWLNLDKRSHHACAGIRELEENGSRAAEEIGLEIGQGEGILWQPGLLRVEEASTNAQEAANKLILLA